LGVPNDAASSLPSTHRPDALQNISDREILLVSRNLLLASVKNDVFVAQLKQPLWPAKGPQESILFCYLAPTFSIDRVEEQTNICESIFEQTVLSLPQLPDSGGGGGGGDRFKPLCDPLRTAALGDRRFFLWRLSVDGCGTALCGAVRQRQRDQRTGR
jgi:hypothetical protein